jgi:signal transduction histidine kinase
MVELLVKIPALNFIILIYGLITLIRLIITTERLFYADLILDIVFISSVIYFNISAYSFMTLTYLLPVFFASVLMKGRLSLLFPIFACLMYALSCYLNNLIFAREFFLDISLHGLSFLAISFAGNAVRDKLENQENYIKKLEEEKIRMESYRRLYRVSADLAHELRNPLATISSAVQLLREGKNDPELINMLFDETRRLTNLANDFLLYSRPSEAPQEKVDVVDVIKVLAAHKGEAKKMILDMENNAIFQGNRTYIEVALDNIIKNAIEAARSYIIVRVKTEKTDMIINIEDDGSGIDEKLIDRVFEPFFTTKKTGTGLGLAISNRIISGFGGTITYSPSPIGGARFTIKLPLSEGE